MARPVTLAAVAGGALLAGCFRPPALGGERSLAVWRESAPPGSRDSGEAAAGVDGGALTADQAYALALKQSPGLAVAEARAEVAAAEVAASKQLDNPELRVTRIRLDDALRGEPTASMSLRVPIPRPGGRRASAQGAELAAAGARAWSEDAKRQLRALIDRHFARMAMLREDIDHVARAAALRAEQAAMLQARVEKAAATRLDLVLAEVAAAEVASEAAGLRDELARTEDSLRAVIGAGPEVRFRVDADELGRTREGLDREALTERALTGRPELRAAQARVGEAAAGAHLARNKAWPWFRWAQLDYYVGPNSTPSSFGLGMSLELPVFSWNRGEIRAAHALVRQREAEERAALAAVAQEVREAVARVERTAARVRELEQTLLPRLDEASRVAAEALAAGALDPVKAVEVEARRIAARRQHLAARLEHREAVIALESAVAGARSDARR